MSDIEALMYTYPDIEDPEFQKLLSIREEFWPPAGRRSMSHRDELRMFVERFMVQYERALLFFSTGAGKTCFSSGAADPLVRNIVAELYETYLSPVRTNINKIIVILSSEHSRDDFMLKIIEKCHPDIYNKVYEETRGENMVSKLGAYEKALSKYIFVTKQTFLTANIYGHNAPPDLIEAPEAALTYYHNSFIIIDEIHTFSREDVGDSSSAQEDLNYARYHNILHRLKGIKLLVMSATPMKDKPEEIIKIMNLLLPLSRQMPDNMDVFDRELMGKYINGYVIYYQMSGIRTIERGVMMKLGDNPGEFVTVFPVKMSERQEAVYKKAISEKDVFNKNALNSSNIFYPQGITKESFRKNFVESPIEGYEPTLEFKNILKSRTNRDVLSRKFSTVVDIVRTTVGVVFIFMRQKDFGIYPLSAFFEAEGFERYFPRMEHPYKTRDNGTREVFLEKKPRFAVLTGETKKIRGKIESILSLSNLPENADGEYIKVIIGSAAVKTSYDVLNSINAIIVSPEQTETSMIQVIGRITRSGGLDALLERHPELKAIVNVYKMASYIGGEEGGDVVSKDIDTYIDSAVKDRKIKKVERILREFSVNCLIHHDINFNKKNIDGSYSCLYGNCDYVCAIPPSGKEELLETDAMDVLYQDDKIAGIMTKIKDLFKDRFYVTIPEIALLADSRSLAFRTVEEMNLQKMKILDRFGQNVYIYFNKKGVYVSPSSIIKPGSGAGLEIHPAEYSHYVTMINITSLDELTDEPVRIPDILEKIMTTTEPVTGSLESDQELLNKFKFFIRREIISKAEVLEHIRIKGLDRKQQQSREEISATSTYWINFSGKLLTHGEMRVYEGDAGILRVPDGFEIPPPTSPGGASSSPVFTDLTSSWIYPDRYLLKVLKRIWRQIMINKFKPFEDKYKYFGVLLPTEPDILHIAERGKDNAKNPGKVCSSWNRTELKLIAEYLGIEEEFENTSKFVKNWCQLLMDEFKKRDALLIL